MLALRLLIFIISAPTLAGIFIVIALVAPLGLDQNIAIPGAVALGALLSIPTSIVVAGMLRNNL